jgi:plastocyanin
MAVLLVAAGITACGGGDGGSGPGGGDELTTVEITPGSATLYSLAPGNTVQLAGVAKNQDGDVMGGVEVTFSSPSAAIATVSDDGLVTAVAAGTVEIKGSATFDGITVDGGSTVTVQVAPGSATVTAPQFAYLPAAVHVSEGGTVTWTFAGVVHDVDFTTAGAPADIPEFDNASDSRAFPASGVYDYQCTRQASMHGTVTVH